MKYEPMRHQKIAYDFCMEHERAGLFLGMGLGKTETKLTVLSTYLWDSFTVRKALVIAPKNVAQNVWAQECRKWDHTQDIRCSHIMGTEKQRKAGLKADADLYIINRENVVWLMEQTKGELPFDMVIIDELSSFKSTKAKRWRVLRKAIQSVRYVLGLTGTPASNGYLDLWPEMYLLDGGARLGTRIGEYRDRYFTAFGRGHIVYRYDLRVGAAATINRKLKDLCISMSAEDWLSLPPVIYNRVTVSLTEKEFQTYKDFMKDKVLPLIDGAVVGIDKVEDMTDCITSDNAAVVAGKLLQLANGAVYTDSGEVVTVHDQKLDALEEIAEANAGETLLVFYEYKHDLSRIKKRFPKAVELKSPADVEKWNRGEIEMLLCHPASAGHGLNLQQGGHIIVWFGMPWSLELYQQANARLPRPGQKQSVFIHHIIAQGTIDEQVMEALQEKNDTQSALLGALKGYLKEELK